MNQCKMCGKTGKNLWLSKSGYCEKCALKIRNERKQKELIKELYSNSNPVAYQKPQSNKDWLVAFLLCLFLGWLGIHRFYVRKTGTGIIWMLTCGCFFIGVIVDFVMLLTGYFTDKSGAFVLNKDRVQVTASPVVPPQTINPAPYPPSKPKENIVYAPQKVEGFPLAYKYENVKIFTKLQLEGIRSDLLGESVCFEKEPDNTYDNKAVAVFCGEEKIGYLYRGRLQDMTNDFIDRGFPVMGHVDSVDDITGDVLIWIGFYKNKAPHRTETKEYTLTGNQDEEAQSAMSLLSEGEEVDVFMDDEKDRYYADSSGFIGFFPKSANEILDQCEHAEVLSIEETDSGKLRVIVLVEY